MRRIAAAAVAAGLAGAVLPLPAAQAGPTAQAGPGARTGQALGGFTTEATATPLKVEVYEPTIPIPAEPQAELSLAYTKTESATGPTTAGRASWAWPGDPVGEGFKTFVEQMGLPKQLGERGYTVQVNSQSPDGRSRQSDQPVPGSVMRTRSSPDGTSVAMAGYSPDGDVTPSGGDGGGAPGAPDPSELPDAPDGEAAADDPGPGALPPRLATLVDASGIASINRSTSGPGRVFSVATSRVHDLSLLGGLVTADAVTVTSRSTSDGDRGTTSTVSRVAGLEVVGKPVTLTGRSVSAPGRSTPIPGLPDQPAEALKALGISFRPPQGHRHTAGGNAAAAVRGLQVVIDTGPLRSKLDRLPLEDLVNEFPNQSPELKAALAGLVALSPRFVVTTGAADATVDTVPAIAIPTVSADALGSATGPATTGTGPGGTAALGGAGTSTGAAALGGAPVASVPGSGVGGDTAVAPQNAAAGLPPLGSVPGGLVVAGFVLASAVGWWLRRIGAFVIGGAGSCSHGLETGVPDLRKA